MWIESSHLDGEGHLEFVTTSTGGGSLTVYCGDGREASLDGGTSNMFTAPVSATSHRVILLNGDGNEDFKPFAAQEGK